MLKKPTYDELKQRNEVLEAELARLNGPIEYHGKPEKKLWALIENTDSSIWLVYKKHKLIVCNSVYQKTITSIIGRNFSIGESPLCQDRCHL